MSSKEKKMAAAAEEAQKNKKFYTKCIIFVVCLAIVIVAAALINSDLSTTKTTAIEIGDTKYTPAEFSYFYRSAVSTAYSELLQYYGDLASYMLNTASPLTEQTAMYGDGEQTWADYFYNEAIVSLTNLTVLYDTATAEGYTLSDEDKEAIEADIAYYTEVAETNGYDNLQHFLSTNFGKGFDEKTLRKIAEKQYIATAYSTDVNDSFTFTADEKEAYYQENTDTFDFITYHSYFVGTSNAAFEEMSDEEKITAAHEAAESIVADIASGAQFVKNVQNFVGEDSKSVYETEDATKAIAQGVSISDIYSEWLLDENRAEGDVTVIDSEGGSYALMFESRNDNHYQLVDARHILISAEADENGEYSEEALAAAKTEAERIHALWLENPTVENFEALVTEYSDDAGSNTNGGLYQEVYQNYMVEEFNDFLFNQGSVPGDSAVVYGSNGGYAGYHVVYFDALGDTFSDRLAESAMRADAYNEEIGAIAENYEVAIGKGMKHVNLD